MENSYTVIKMDKLVANDQIDSKLMFMETVGPQGVVYPCPGLHVLNKYIYINLFSNIFSKNTRLTKTKFYVKPTLEGKTIYINGPGHITKTAATPIFDKINPL